MEILLARGARTILWGGAVSPRGYLSKLVCKLSRADLFVFVKLRSPVKPGMTYDNRRCPIMSGMTMSFSDALSYNVQIVNKIGLKFQQNRLKVNTNIVLYQNLVEDTILQILIDIVLYQVLF